MPVYLTSGLFALGGVALAGLFAEIRAFRENRIKENSEITSLKRETYSNAIQQMELVASKVAWWAGADYEENAERSRAFWDELTLAYQILNKVRLIARTEEPADAMRHVLAIYRMAVEKDERVLPKSGSSLDDLIGLFRVDLGLTSQTLMPITLLRRIQKIRPIPRGL